MAQSIGATTKTKRKTKKQNATLRTIYEREKRRGFNTPGAICKRRALLGGPRLSAEQDLVAPVEDLPDDEIEVHIQDLPVRPGEDPIEHQDRVLRSGEPGAPALSLVVVRGILRMQGEPAPLQQPVQNGGPGFLRRPGLQIPRDLQIARLCQTVLPQKGFFGDRVGEAADVQLDEIAGTRRSPFPPAPAPARCPRPDGRPSPAEPLFFVRS